MRILMVCIWIVISFDFWYGAAAPLKRSLRCADARVAIRNRTGAAQAAEFTRLGTEELGRCFENRLIDEEEGLGDKLRERLAQGDRMVETRLLLGRSKRSENRELLTRMQNEAQGDLKWRADRPAVPEKYVAMVARMPLSGTEVNDSVMAGARDNVAESLFLLAAMPYLSRAQMKAGLMHLLADKRPAFDQTRVCDHTVAALGRWGRLDSAPFSIRTGKQYSDAELAMVKRRILTDDSWNRGWERGWEHGRQKN